MSFSISVDYATPAGVIATQIGDALSSIGLESIAQIGNSASIVTAYSFGVPDFSFDFFSVDFGTNYQGWMPCIFGTSLNVSIDVFEIVKIDSVVFFDIMATNVLFATARYDIVNQNLFSGNIVIDAPEIIEVNSVVLLDVAAQSASLTTTQSDIVNQSLLLGGISIDAPEPICSVSAIQINTYAPVISNALFRSDIQLPFSFDATATPIAWTVPIPIGWSGSLVKEAVLPAGTVASVLRDLSAPLARSGTLATDAPASLIAGSGLTRDFQVPLLWAAQTYVIVLDAPIPLRTGATVSDDVLSPFTARSGVSSDFVLRLGSSAISVVTDAPSAIAVTSSVWSDVLAQFRMSAALGSDQPIGMQTVSAFIREVPLVVQWQTMLFPVVADDAIPLLTGATEASDSSIPVIWEPPPWFRHEWYSRTVAPGNTYVTYVEGLPVRIIIR